MSQVTAPWNGIPAIPKGHGVDPPAPQVQLLPIFDLFLEDETRLSRDEDHISALAADYQQCQKQRPGEHPVQTPLRVVRRGDKWVIIAGAYRFLAGLRARLNDLPCIDLGRELDEADKLIEQAKDNELHKPYTAMERARNILKLKTLRPDLSQAEAGRLLGILPADSAKLLRVLNHYPSDLQPLIGEGDNFVPITAAYQFARLMAKTKDEVKVRELTDRVVKGLLSRDDATKVVAGLLSGGSHQKKAKPMKLTFGGVVMTIKGKAVDELTGLHAKLGEVLKRLHREGWGDELLGGLMR